MNLKQLEDITSHTDKITELIASDKNGMTGVTSALDTFKRLLDTELRAAVYRKYLENKQ